MFSVSSCTDNSLFSIYLYLVYFCFFFFQYIYFFFFLTLTFQLLDKPLSQVSSLLPSGSFLQFFFAHRVQQSHCSSIFHGVLLTHALALSASQFVRKKKSQRIYTSMQYIPVQVFIFYTSQYNSMLVDQGRNMRNVVAINIEGTSAR